MPFDLAQVFDSEADNLNAFNDALLGVARLHINEIGAELAKASSSKRQSAEITLPLDTSVYDGKLKAYHSRLAAPDSTVTVLARFTMSPDAERDRRKPNYLPMLLAAIISTAAAAAGLHLALMNPLVVYFAAMFSLAMALGVMATLAFALMLGAAI